MLEFRQNVTVFAAQLLLVGLTAASAANAQTGVTI